MSIVYIGQSQAEPDTIADLRNFLTSIGEFMKLVAGPPSGRYYDPVV